jgi:hypothetical protein
VLSQCSVRGAGCGCVFGTWECCQQQLLLLLTHQQPQQRPQRVVKSKRLPTQQQQQRVPHLAQTWNLLTYQQTLQACLLRHSSCCSSVARQLRGATHPTPALPGCAATSRRAQQQQQRQQQVATAMLLLGPMLLMLLALLRIWATLLRLTQPWPPPCQQQQPGLRQGRQRCLPGSCQQQRHQQQRQQQALQPAQAQQHAGMGCLSALTTWLRPLASAVQCLTQSSTWTCSSCTTSLWILLAC